MKTRVVYLVDTITIILNWNCSDMTINLVQDFMKIENENTDIIILDNGSNEKEKIKLINFCRNQNWELLYEDFLDSKNTKYNKGYLVLLKSNYGYAKGNNFGLKLAYKLNYKYCLIANNDIILKTPIIRELKSQLQRNENIAIIGPKVIGPNGNWQGPYEKVGLYECFFYPVFYPILYPIEKIRKKIIKKALEKSLKQSNFFVYSYSISGCCMLTKIKALAEVEFFDTNTFLYWEEGILSEKLIKKGFLVAFYSKIYIQHLEGHSTNKLNKKKNFLYISSALYYFQKYRKYGHFRIFLIKLGLYISMFVLQPFIKKIKSQHSTF